MVLEPTTVGFRPGERNVFFHLLTGCNLSCKHCYINKEQHGTNMLSLATVKSWLELFRPTSAAGNNSRSNLILLGGEPTLHPELPDIICFAKELGFAVTVDSNGFLFHNVLEKTNPQQLDFLSFSLDGPDPAVNDPIRGDGVFEVCSSNLKRAAILGFNVSLIYTVSNRNIRHLHRMVPLLAEWGVKKFFIQVIGLRGESAKTSSDKEQGCGDWQVSPEQWLEVVPGVARQAAEKGIHVIYPKVYLDPNEEFECAGLTAENYFIFPNGRVYRCPLCEDYPINELKIENNRLLKNEGLMEDSFFQLDIPEGCVMNKLLQPDNVWYNEDGTPVHRISCCLLKQEMMPENPKIDDRK